MTRHTAARLRLTTLEDRLTPAGWLDPTFGSGGVAPAGLPPTQEHSSGRMATMPDGHIVVVSNNQVTRLNADGSPDLTFGTRGSVTLASPSLAVAAGPGGTTYVLTVRANPRGEGPQTADVQQLAELIRLTPSGALDTTFDDDGLAFVTKGQVYGSYSSGLAVNSGEAVVATSQENLRKFSGGGAGLGELPRITPANGSSMNDLVGMYPTRDGGVLVVDRQYRPNAGGQYRMFAVLTRFTASGELDAGYGTGGQTFLEEPGTLFNGNTVGLGLDAAGGMLLAMSGPGRPLLPVGVSARTNTVLRVTPTGQLDTAFAGDGSAELEVPRGGVVVAGAALADGRVLVFSRNNSDGRGMFAHLLAADGTADAGFAEGGWLKLTGGAMAEFVLTDTEGNVRCEAVVLPDGRVAVLGVNASAGGRRELSVAVVSLTAETPPGGVDVNPSVIPAPGPIYIIDDPIRPIGDPVVVERPVRGVPSLGHRTPGDLNGDGVADKVVTDGSKVSVVSGADGSVLVKSFAPFEASYTGTLNGVLVDIDYDGKSELVVAPGQGGGPVVAVYNSDGTERGRFWGIEDRDFRGGVGLAAGYLNGDITQDLVVTAGAGGGPRVAVFDGSTLGANARRVVADFFAFEATQRGGAVATVAGGVLVFGAGPGGAPRVRGLFTRNLGAAGAAGNLDGIPVGDQPFTDRFVGDPARRDGVKLAVRPIPRGPNSAYRSEVTGDPGDGKPEVFFPFDPILFVDPGTS